MENVFFVVEEDAADVHVGIEAGDVKKAYDDILAVIVQFILCFRQTLYNVAIY